MPGLLGGFLLLLALNFVLLNVWLLAFPVKVLTKQVKDRVDALVRVLLTIACKSGVVLAQDPLEELRCYTLRFVVPHLVDQLCVRHHQSAIGA